MEISKWETQFQFAITGWRAYEHKVPLVKKVKSLHVDGGAELQLESFLALALDEGKWSDSQPGHLTARQKKHLVPTG